MKKVKFRLAPYYTVSCYVTPTRKEVMKTLCANSANQAAQTFSARYLKNAAVFFKDNNGMKNNGWRFDAIGYGQPIYVTKE